MPFCFFLPKNRFEERLTELKTGCAHFENFALHEKALRTAGNQTGFLYDVRISVILLNINAGFPSLQGFWENLRRFPTCVFFFFFKVEISLHTLIPLFMPRSVSQWLSELTPLWTSVPWWAECELISLTGSHTMPGQQGQPTPTLLGQGCMHI